MGSAVVLHTTAHGPSFSFFRHGGWERSKEGEFSGGGKGFGRLVGGVERASACMRARAEKAMDTSEEGVFRRSKSYDDVFERRTSYDDVFEQRTACTDADERTNGRTI